MRNRSIIFNIYLIRFLNNFSLYRIENDYGVLNSKNMLVPKMIGKLRSAYN